MSHRTSIVHMNNENQSNAPKIEDSIAKLEAMLHLSFEMPKIGTFIKPATLQQHLNEIKAAVQKDLEHSRSIIQKEEEILAEANVKAEEFVRRSRREIESQNIVKEAQIFAKKLVVEAQNQAQALLSEGQQVQQQLIINGHKYIDQLLLEVEDELRLKGDKVAANREELMNSLHERKKKSELSS